MIASLEPHLERSLLDGINVGIFTIDADCKVLSWNRFMEINSSVTSHDVVDRNLFDVFPDLPRAWLERKVRSVFLLGNYGFVSWRQRPHLFAFRHNRPITGGVTNMQQDCTLIPLRGADGTVKAVCITLIDATDASMLQKQAEESAALLREAMVELERLSWNDGLTGIFNRRSLDARLAASLNRFSRYGTPFSLLLFDLDHFKKVNDRFGHLGGDEVLRVVARRVAAAMRETDTVGRYGGEEFMVLMPSTSLQQALVVAERTRKIVCDEPIPFADGVIEATISGGVCGATRELASSLDMIAHADGALYAAKAGGRNCVRAHPVLSVVPAAPLRLIVAGSVAPPPALQRPTMRCGSG